MPGIQSRVMSPADFIDQLSRGAIVLPVELTGWAKPDIESPDLLQFSPGQQCGNWIAVPLGLIDSVEYLGIATCEDHQHPIVKISIAVPDAPDARAIFMLLAVVASKSGGEMQRRRSTADHGVPRFGPQCHICMERCREAHTYDEMVNCSHECMWTYC